MASPSRLRTAGHQANLRDRVQLRVVPGVAVLAARNVPVADAVDQRDGAERAPAPPRGPAEAFEERTRGDDRPARPRPRREAPGRGHRGGQVRALPVVEDERDVAVLLQPVLDDLSTHPPDPPLEAGPA